jgi:ABC-type transport system involved in cytochrome c biogenesis permease subunit
MEIKTTLQGILIYSVMLSYLLGIIFYLIKKIKYGKALFAFGFIIACVAFGYRYYDVGHWPMQNLFEVFLSLGLLIYPISIFSEKILGVKGGASDMILGIIILFPAGFIFSAEPQQLPPALQSWLFAPHVAVYMISYVLMAKATIQAVFQLRSKSYKIKSAAFEKSTYYMVLAGFPFLTAGLLLGSWWGKICWGDYWGWDPKELWSLISWLVYIGYLHFRYMFKRKYLNINSILAIIGMAAIIITLIWVNLSRLFPGLHNYAS